jgi:hypothetical protein
MLKGRVAMGTPASLSMLNKLFGWVVLAREEMTDAVSRADPGRLLAQARRWARPPSIAGLAGALRRRREVLPTSKVYRRAHTCRGGRERRPGHGIDTGAAGGA